MFLKSVVVNALTLHRSWNVSHCFQSVSPFHSVTVSTVSNAANHHPVACGETMPAPNRHTISWSSVIYGSRNTSPNERPANSVACSAPRPHTALLYNTLCIRGATNIEARLSDRTNTLYGCQPVGRGLVVCGLLRQLVLVRCAHKLRRQSFQRRTSYSYVHCLSNHCIL